MEGKIDPTVATLRSDVDALYRDRLAGHEMEPRLSSIEKRLDAVEARLQRIERWAQSWRPE